MQLYEDIVYNVASIRVLLGHLLYRAKDQSAALMELEAACPVLWKYKVSWRGLDSDVGDPDYYLQFRKLIGNCLLLSTQGWLDCLSTLSHIYVNNGSQYHAQLMEGKLNNMIPWLPNIFKTSTAGKGSKEKEKTKSTASAQNMEPLLPSFLQLSSDDRKLLSTEIKTAWKYIEAIRSAFELLIEDFVETESSRVKLNVYLR